MGHIGTELLGLSCLLPALGQLQGRKEKHLVALLLPPGFLPLGRDFLGEEPGLVLVLQNQVQELSKTGSVCRAAAGSAAPGRIRLPRSANLGLSFSPSARGSPLCHLVLLSGTRGGSERRPRCSWSLGSFPWVLGEKLFLEPLAGVVSE